jgi:hypothetical protein
MEVIFEAIGTISVIILAIAYFRLQKKYKKLNENYRGLAGKQNNQGELIKTLILEKLPKE